MKKIILGTVVGGVVWFVWGMVSWTILPWHDMTIKRLPEETLIRDTLKIVVKDPGFYFFPSDKTESGRMETQQWNEMVQKGPVGVIVFNPEGGSPMSARHFLVSLGIGFLFSAFLLWIFFLSKNTLTHLKGRLGLALGVGLVAWLIGELPYWNWFYYPCSFVMVALADKLAGAALVGISITKFVPSENKDLS